MPSDANAKGISWMSSWRSGVLMRRSAEAALRWFREDIEQEIECVAIGDVAVVGLLRKFS